MLRAPPSQRHSARQRGLRQRGGGRTAGDGAETLLPGRVPNLQLHPLVLQQDLLYFEVDAARRPRTASRPAAGLQGALHRATSAAPPRAPDSGDEAGCERVLAEAQQQAALPHACAPRQGRPPSLDHRGRSTMAPRRRRPPNSAQTPAAPGRTAVANEQQLDEVVIVLPARGHLPGRPPRAAAHCITLRRKACPRCLPTLRSGPGQPPCTRAALENTSFDRFVQGLGL